MKRSIDALIMALMQFESETKLFASAFWRLSLIWCGFEMIETKPFMTSTSAHRTMKRLRSFLLPPVFSAVFSPRLMPTHGRRKRNAEQNRAGNSL